MVGVLQVVVGLLLFPPLDLEALFFRVLRDMGLEVQVQSNQR